MRKNKKLGGRQQQNHHLGALGDRKMITTKRHCHSRGVLPLKAPPWIHDHHHQYVISLLLITYSIFLHQLTPTSFTTGSFVPIDNSPPLPSNQLLLDLFLDQTLFPTNSKNKNHKTTHPSPANTLHPITSSHRPPPPPLPTTTLPSSGTHVHIPPTPLSTHTLYQFPRIFENILLRLDPGIHHIRIILLQLYPGTENILLQLDRTHVPSTSFTTHTRTKNLTKTNTSHVRTQKLTKTNTSHVPSTSTTPNNSHIESPKKNFLCTQGIHHHTHTTEPKFSSSHFHQNNKAPTPLPLPLLPYHHHHHEPPHTSHRH